MSYVRTPEIRAKIAAALRGRRQSSELVERRVAPLRGRRLSEEHRQKMSIAQRGRSLTSSHIAALIGKKRSAAGCRNISIALKNSVRARTQLATLLSHRRSKLEKFCESILRSLGISFVRQFRLPDNSHPFDFAIVSDRILIEADGCYWHGCDCYSRSLKSAKTRDSQLDEYARSLGWTVLRFKACEQTIDWSLAS